MNSDVIGTAMEELLKQGSYMNMQAFFKGNCGGSVKREPINRKASLKAETTQEAVTITQGKDDGDLDWGRD